jgi:hypothetical protein
MNQAIKIQEMKRAKLFCLHPASDWSSLLIGIGIKAFVGQTAYSFPVFKEAENG